MSIKLKDIYFALDKIFPFAIQESWDNSGVQVGLPNDEISGVYFATDICFETIERAKRNQCNLIVTHHPSIFRAPKTVGVPVSEPESGISPAGILTAKLMREKIDHIAIHTNADQCYLGTADIVARLLELKNIETLITNSSSANFSNKEIGLGRIGEYTEKISLLELLEKLKNILSRYFDNQVPIKYTSSDLGLKIQKIALLPGSGDDLDFLQAARKKGADVYITSDLRHHPALDQLTINNYYKSIGQKELVLIDVPHSVIESLFLRVREGENFVGKCLLGVNGVFETKLKEVIESNKLEIKIVSEALESTDPFVFF
ncbi:MAG: Nif3-like dinuclear metal center hexameric protein [Candidatus Ancillula sp.]|jgi:dinuclear metal center YbgI/SA1388 family protein|nr:Nif3-like dinuclear metal center hexameric protein [Candidatus Ancillula sp.]